MACVRQLLVRPKIARFSLLKYSSLTSLGTDGLRHKAAHAQQVGLRAMGTANTKRSTDNDKVNSAADPEDVIKDGSEQTSSKTDVVKYDYDDYDDYEPKTAGEAVSMYTSMGLRLLFFVVAAGCILVTLRELFPGRLGPHNLFSEAFEAVKNHDEV